MENGTVALRQFPFRMMVKGGSGLLHRLACNDGDMAFVGVLHGKARIRIGLHVLDAPAGELFFVPPSQLLIIEAISDFASVRIMTFHRSILTDNMDSLERDLLYMLTVQARVAPFCMDAEHPLYDKLSAQLQTAEEEYLAKEPCSRLIIRASVYRMVTELLRHYSTKKKDSEHAVYHNVMRLKGALDRIDSDTDGKATVAQLSKMLFVSADHFTRIFRDSLGVTPIEYMNRVRIERALVLLADTTLTMDQISRRAGFSATSYFYRLFRSLVGITPLAFKKQYF